ncbi:MAG: YfhO family protein [Elusimicrobiota bacterium]
MAEFLVLSGAIVAVVFGKFLVGRAVYLYKDIGSDSINIFYPGIALHFEYWKKEGLPGWSFSQGLGQNIYPFSWNDPFYLILIPFGRERWAYGIALMEAVKLLSAGALFRLYLKKLRVSDDAATAGALLYAFSGYVVLGGGWNIFSTEAVYLALLLYVFERILSDGDWGLAPVPFALLALLQPYDLYPFSLFLAVYGTIRHADERAASAKDLFAFWGRFAAWGLLGVALGGVYFFSDVLQLLQSPRVGGAASWFRALSSRPVFALPGPAEAATSVLRLFSSDALGTGSGYRGWRSYLEGPLYYCGLSTVLLAPQSFAFLDARRRRLYAALAGLVFLPVVFPYARYAFWAFSGDYYRILSLFVATVLVFLAARALDRLLEGEAPRRSWIFVPLAASLGLLFLPSFLGAPAKAPVLDVCAFFLLAEGAAICWMRSKPAARAARGIFLGLVCVEAALFSSITVGTRPVVSAGELAARVGYNDYTIEAVTSLKASDPSFYRIVKDYHSGLAVHASLNDAKVQGYHGISSYSQFNPIPVVEFLGELGVIDPKREVDTHFLRGLDGRPALQSLLAVKYLLHKGSGGPNPVIWEAVGSFGDVSVFRYKNFLPLSFAYDRLMTRGGFDALGAAAKEAALLESAVVEDGEAAEFSGLPRAQARREPLDAASFERAVSARRGEGFEPSARTENFLAGRFSASGPRILFFSIPYDAGWRARVDGRPAELRRVDLGFQGLRLEAGEHRVELEFTPPLRRFGAAVSVLALILYAALLAARRLSPGMIP